MNSYSKIKGTEKDFVANFVLKASRGDSDKKVRAVLNSL